MKGYEALFDSLKAAGTELELAGFLRELATAFGFTGFSLVDIPAAADQRLSTRIVLSDLPFGFIESYDALGLLKNSPVFAALRRSTVPQIWSIDNVPGERPSDEIDPARQLFSRHNLTMGVYIPVHGPSGERAAVGFGGARPALTHTELAELAILAAHAYDVYTSLKCKHDGTVELLSARELEALHWAANGKTSSEIASIMSLSDHTVNTYMNSAMRKLDCVNRTQLVAKALRLRLIS